MGHNGKVVGIEFRPEDVARLKEFADSKGMKMRPWMRRVVLNAAGVRRKVTQREREGIANRLAKRDQGADTVHGNGRAGMAAVRPYGERVPAPAFGEDMDSYGDRLARWVSVQKDREAALGAADAAYRDYCQRWPEIQRQIVEAKRA